MSENLAVGRVGNGQHLSVRSDGSREAQARLRRCRELGDGNEIGLTHHHRSRASAHRAAARIIRNLGVSRRKQLLQVIEDQDSIIVGQQTKAIPTVPLQHS